MVSSSRFPAIGGDFNLGRVQEEAQASSGGWSVGSLDGRDYRTGGRP